MKSFGSYSFLTILIESIRLLPRNGKLMALIAGLSIFLSLCFFSLFNYSIQSLAADMMVTVLKSFMPDPSSFDMPNPNTFDSADPTSLTPTMGFDLGPFKHLQGDLAVLFAVEIAFFIAFSIIFFFSSISTILVSAHSYSARNLSLKELFSIISKTWTRPLITSFSVSCLSTGYTVTVLFLATPLLMFPSIPTFWVAIFVGIPASILYLYLLVPWIMSIVISVVEESSYGMKGLGKAAALVQGKRLHGFLLNVFYGLLVSVVCKGYKMLLQSKGSVAIAFLLLTIVSSLVQIFQMVAYTVLYLQCKEHHGEEIELHGSPQYSIVLANDMP